MATITLLPSGYWRVQVRRRGNYASKTFRIKSDAQRWSNEQEDRVERGEGITTREAPSDTLGDLIELHLADMAEVGRAARRSKEYTLNCASASATDPAAARSAPIRALLPTHGALV